MIMFSRVVLRKKFKIDGGVIMKPLIFIVEDNGPIRKILVKVLNGSGINYMFASDLKGAIAEFENTKKCITHIALDYTLVDSNGTSDNTSVLAKIIADSIDFKGKVYVMSGSEEDNDLLMSIIGKKCENIVDCGIAIKLDTINEIIRKIKEAKVR